tara:strand:- start:541 stop:813 length:273 start_codon:yes stop_codon:yes gene_type:complete
LAIITNMQFVDFHANDGKLPFPRFGTAVAMDGTRSNEEETMYEQAHPQRTVGKAVLVTILAFGALVAMNPLSADSPHSESPLVLKVTELA